MVVARKPWDVPGLNCSKNLLNQKHFMVAARKPLDKPDLSLLQKLAKSRMSHGSRPQTMGHSWPQTASKTC